MASPLPWTLISLAGAGFLFLHPWLLAIVIAVVCVTYVIAYNKATKPKARGYRVYNGYVQSFRQA